MIIVVSLMIIYDIIAPILRTAELLHEYVE